MSKQWSDVELWALAEQLSGIMDALKHGDPGPHPSFKSQPELPLGPGGNVIAFDPSRRARQRGRRVRPSAQRTAT